MSPEDKVNLEASGRGVDSRGGNEPGDAAPPWWRRRPALGIAASLTAGMSTALLLGALGPPAQGAGAAFVYLVTLPIALLMPALALAAALIAWQALGAARPALRPLLIVPATIAFAANIVSLGMFLRFVLQVLAV